jgi:hypothetical protein
MEGLADNGNIKPKESKLESILDSVGLAVTAVLTIAAAAYVFCTYADAVHLQQEGIQKADSIRVEEIIQNNQNLYK